MIYYGPNGKQYNYTVEVVLERLLDILVDKGTITKDDKIEAYIGWTQAAVAIDEAEKQGRPRSEV